MKCTFCRKELPVIGSLKYVKSNGDVKYFCNAKCEKSFLLKRDYRKQKWITKQKN